MKIQLYLCEKMTAVVCFHIFEKLSAVINGNELGRCWTVGAGYVLLTKQVPFQVIATRPEYKSTTVSCQFSFEAGGRRPQSLLRAEKECVSETSMRARIKKKIIKVYQKR